MKYFKHQDPGVAHRVSDYATSTEASMQMPENYCVPYQGFNISRHRELCM